MSKNEILEVELVDILEVELVDILEQYQLIYWNRAGLALLIKYAQREKEYLEYSNNTHMMNEMTKIIEIAQTLMKTKRTS